MPVPPGAERGEMGTFFFLKLFNFLFLFIYIIFMCTRVSDNYVSVYVQMWDQCVQQILRGPGDVLDQRQYQQHRRTTTTAGGPPAGEAERVLRWVERNLTVLTRTVPMAEIEDLPPSMQPHVVGVPQTWVHLFRHLENVVVHYGRANRPRA
jgi:hypothetical protein